MFRQFVFKYNKLHPLFLLIIIPVLIFSGCIDDDPLTDADGNDIGSFRFASGPAYGSYYSYADGIVDAANEKMGIFMSNDSTNGSLDNAERLVTGNTYLGNAYMAMMQEDVFEFLRKDCISKYNADPDTVNKNYLKAASRTKVLLALYTETVHLLVRDGSGITKMEELSGHSINLGPTNSGTYVTAKTILNAWTEAEAPGFTYDEKNDDPAVGIQKVVNGEYDAAFFVTAVPSSLFADIPASATVELIQVTMPDGAKTYSENVYIPAKDYPFQSADISGNISVRTLLVGGPRFYDKNLTVFLDYLFDNAEEYKAYNQKWGDLSLALSQDYMKANPEKCNFKAICYVSGFPELDPYYVDDNFFTEYGVSCYHDMYTELDYLLTINTGMGLKEVNTTGTWENAYRLMRGEGLMALVQDDIFEYLKGNDDMYDSMIAASMKKLVPLHYEYVHLLSNGGVSISTILSAASDVNVGPKTSGTFITAMNIISSYTVNANITYHFDEASDAITKVNSGTYDAAFIVTGVPYNKFYSHDTWDISSLSSCDIVAAAFNGTTPYPYKQGVIAGNSSSSENYPYKTALLASDTITTTQVRALQVVSPVFENSDIDIYLKSVFRKGYYMTIPPDTGSGFITDPLWIPVIKESMSSTEAVAAGYTSTYGETHIEGAMEYFVNNPFGWYDAAADYYLSMFQD